MSPILRTIVVHCLTRSGSVFVIHGGGGMGKTTALFAVMGRYARKGVAFSPGELSGEYEKIMLHRIGLNVKNPPNGWLEKFLDELKAPWSENPAVLMLDDFMNNRPDDLLDKALLKNLRNAVRGKNIVVFVLTTNEKSANLMITWNTMNSIVPAAPHVDVCRYRRQFNEHQQCGEAETEFSIEWNEQNRRRWETDELKTAVLVSPKHVDKNQAEKATLATKIDAYIESLSEGARETLNPSVVLDHLYEADAANLDVLASPRDGWSSSLNCAFGAARPNVLGDGSGSVRRVLTRL